MSYFSRMFAYGWAVPALVALCGCYNTSLPEKLSVPLPAARSVVADADTGPFSLAGSQWRVFGTHAVYQNTGEVDDNGGVPWLIGDIEFGDRGEVTTVTLGEVFYHDILIRDYLGETIFIDATPHPAATPETSYVAESYGASEGNVIGVTILFRYFVGPIEGFTASISIPGTLSEDGNRIDGTMTIALSFDTDVWEVDPSLVDTVAIEFYAEKQ